MTDTTRLTPHCLIRWGAGVPLETREATLRKMQAIRPLKPARVLSHERARKLAEESAHERLTATTETLFPDGRWMVRIYYRSMGDETLCFEAGPMSGQAAVRMVSMYTGGPTEALGTDKYRADEPGRIPPLWKGARRVVLPSQLAEPVVSLESLVEKEIPLTLCLPSDGYEPDDSRDRAEAEARFARALPGRFYQEARDRRAQRFRTMHRRSIAA